MELIPEVLKRLTDTEKKIVMTYAERGGSAKELAVVLGVSERTVYKALYKYRKIAKTMGIDPSKFYLRQNLASGSNGNGSVLSGPIDSASIVNEIREAVLRDIKKIVEESVKEALKEVLSKQVLGIELTSETDKRSSIVNDPLSNISERLVVLLERLSYGIDNLNNNIKVLSSKIDRINSLGYQPRLVGREGSNEKSVVNKSISDLPSYVVDNPWLEVLSRK